LPNDKDIRMPPGLHSGWSKRTAIDKIGRF
jgi:hypothetical protein